MFMLPLHLTACLRFASHIQMPFALRKHAKRYTPFEKEVKTWS